MTRQKLDNIRDNMSPKMLFHPSKWQDFPRVSRVTKLSKMTGETEISVWRARVIVANSDMAGSRVPMFHIQTIGVINRYMLPFRSHLFIPPCVSWKGEFFSVFFYWYAWLLSSSRIDSSLDRFVAWQGVINVDGYFRVQGFMSCDSFRLLFGILILFFFINYFGIDMLKLEIIIFELY